MPRRGGADATKRRYYNDSAAAIMLIKMQQKALILEPDAVYVKSPLELAQMHKNKDCLEIFNKYISQRDLDEHWHHKGLA